MSLRAGAALTFVKQEQEAVRAHAGGFKVCQEASVAVFFTCSFQVVCATEANLCQMMPK